MSLVWLSKKARHVGEGGLRGWILYWSAVDSATMWPSNVSSDWMRGVPPERVLAGHALDQPLDLDFDLGSADLAGSRLTSPIQLESLPMPTNHGVRLHDEQNGLPIRPDLRQKRPEDPITPSQPGGFRLLSRIASCWRSARFSAASSVRSRRTPRKNNTKMRVTPISQPPKRSITA